jgi:hypothetical protein
MTTYSYKLVLKDTEAFMLEDALKLMIEHCDEQMWDGLKAPFWAYKHAAESVQKKAVCQHKSNKRKQFRTGQDRIT